MKIHTTETTRFLKQVELEKSEESVLITAMDQVEFKKAENALDELIIIRKVPVSKDADIAPESADFENFKAEQETNQILKVYMETTGDKNAKKLVLLAPRRT